ncbi:hypothetical protein [Roseomonas fluvialis]|uniref:Sugar ABC transporter permease n=1 Tax=Roseomonas fluvialis TaxID=1750527 RepID=A0ABN6P184_9PROT|nr:hypothetical protein [Roseomonas fluvialis]BDG71508.1 hypothetical protein Rmf_14370 [Roseomonas fluvialis]
MADATPITQLSVAPAAAAASRHDDTAMARGLVNGLLLSIPLWALIVCAFAAMF